MIRELQEQNKRLVDDQNRVANYEDQFTILGNEIERLNSVLAQMKKNEEHYKNIKDENEYLTNNQKRLNQELNNLKI